MLDQLPKAPSLPAWMLYSVLFATALVILFVMARARSRQGAFVIGAAWLRYVMQGFHTITYNGVAGMTFNAMGSMATFAIGLLVINWRHLMLRFLLPFYVLIALAIVSALANDGITPDVINVVVKHGYLIVMVLSVFGAMRKAKSGDFMTALLWAFLPTVLWQILSVVFNIAKATETDITAVSFIGGYDHEASFSVILATALTVTCFATQMNKMLQTGLIVLFVVGIVLANYRTTLVAIAPLLVMFFAFSSLSRFPFRDRPFVVSALIVIAAIIFGSIGLLFAERFQDVTVAASGDVNFFKRSEYYTVEESRLLSGRPRIWSSYIFAWLDGDLEEYVIGFGPESWNDNFYLYAHNTLVNYLYEYGIVGVVVLLWVWFSMLAAALRVRHPHAGVVVGAHLTFLVLNMATMPMWMIEGNILYGIICGYTLYLLSLQSVGSTQAMRRN
jgi:O-Antigen ligase